MCKCTFTYFLDNILNWSLNSCFQTLPWTVLTFHSFFRSHDSMYLYIVTEKFTWLLNLSRMVFSLTFTFLILLCLKWTPSQEKHIFLGGMNHCWLNHLLLRAETRSSGSSCDVWVSCSGSSPLWLLSSWLNILSNGDDISPCISHRVTVRSDEFL